MLALAAQAILLVALVAHGPWAPERDTNLVGVAGRFLAGAFHGTFGIASFLLLAMGLYITVLALARKRADTARLRLAGCAMLVIGACGLVHQFLPGGYLPAEGSPPFGLAPGGVVGETLFDFLHAAVGLFGAAVLGIVLLCTGFAFATDWLLYEIAFDGVRRLSGTTSLLSRFWPKFAFASATAVKEPPARGVKSATAAEAKPRPSVRAIETADERGDGALELDDPMIEVPPELVPPPLPTESPRRAPSSAKKDAKAEPDDETPAGELDEDTPLAEPEPPKPIVAVRFEPPARPERRPAARTDKPKRKGDYEYPSSQLLDRPKPRNLKQLESSIQANADVLQRTLAEFKVEGQVVAYQQGPVVTMLEVALSPGTKVTKIHALSDDLAMALKAESVRIVAPIPGKSTVGVEIPNPIREDVRLLELLECPEFRNVHHAVPILLGATADGRPLVEDLASMPHLLIAGSTGSGKSVCINAILLSILLTRSPDEVRLILVDPKQVELAFFADIPHLLSPVVTDMKRAAQVLEWALDKMEERYDLLHRFEVRNLASYNDLGEKAIRERAKALEMEEDEIHVRLPYVVIVVDELADLMLSCGKDVEIAITRLAQKSRAVGIHVILATQRPSTDVITGLIKANMPTRIAFKVASKVDSRVILDQNGADKLLGMGDMLYLPPRSSMIARAQGTYAADREVKRVVSFLRERYPQEFNEELVEIGTAPLLDSSEKDELYDEAVRIVLTEQRGSASLLQRALAIGYTRASRLLDLMRSEGVVGTYKGSKASEVMMQLEEYEALVAAQGAGGGGDRPERSLDDGL